MLVVSKNKNYWTPAVQVSSVSAECGFAASEIKATGATIYDAPESDYGSF